MQQLLGRTMPQTAISLHVFNHQASLTSIAMIKSSCIGASSAFPFPLLVQEYIAAVYKATPAFAGLPCS